MRMNARYKIVSFLLTFMAASMAFVGLTRIFEYGYAVNVVILASVVFLFVEGWRILQLDAYLSTIERRIKEMTKISTDGWETYLRSLGSEGEKPTKWLSIALVALIAPIYTIFNYVASFVSGFTILTVNESQLLTIRWAFFILMEIPIMYCIFKALPNYKAWAKAVSATLTSNPEPSKMSKESKVTMKDMLLLVEGILIAFIIQLFYDTLREEPLYKNLLPIQYWRSILAVICGIFAFLILNYFKKHSASS